MNEKKKKRHFKELTSFLNICTYDHNVTLHSRHKKFNQNSVRFAAWPEGYSSRHSPLSHGTLTCHQLQIEQIYGDDIGCPLCPSS
jgi:hypothetical protein